MPGRTDIEHYASERAREERETADLPHKEAAEVHGILRSYGLDEDDASRVGASASVVVTLLALLVFGYIKGLFTTGKPARSAIQTVLVGGRAASAAFVIAKALG